MQEMLALLDAWLDLTTHRDRFTSDEIRDLVLDLRLLVTREPVP